MIAANAMPPAPSKEQDRVADNSTPTTMGSDDMTDNMDDVAVQADETGNTMPNAHDTTNNGVDDLAKENEGGNNPSRLCESEPVLSTRRKAARSRWDFVKSLHGSVTRAERREFKTGARVSLTTAEATFLSMIAKSRLDGDHELAMDPEGPGEGRDLVPAGPSSPGSPNSRLKKSLTGGMHFTHVVQAAVAKERLRDSIKSRLSSLSGAEAKFLTKLVENKSVTLEALENAVHVLDNDPLYNPNLRLKSEFISDFDVGGLDDSEEGNDEEEDGGKDIRSHLRRRSSVKESYRHFDRLMDDLEVSQNTRQTMREKRKKYRPRRSSGTEESEVLNIALEGFKSPEEDESENTLSGSRRVRRGLSRRASVLEKSVWKLAYGDDTSKGEDEFGKELAQNPTVELDEDGVPVKSTKPGDAMDPLLMAVPVEKTPAIAYKKTLDDSVGSSKASKGDRKVGLEQLLSSSGRETPALPLQGKARKEETSLVDDKPDMKWEDTMTSYLCCGMEGISFMEDYPNENDDAANEGDDAAPIEEEDSLASKKRYLHLEERMAEDDRQTKLSTWMGSPEDYPILGLKKKPALHVNDDDVDADDARDDDEADGDDLVDPLEPHVLSPLLMKCLRDHLPYALREENFWLKYSLARDGASLEVIFQTMRHSPHSILAIETSTGEVFGSFTSSPWRSNGNQYYGSCEAFVWMLRKSRRDEDGGDSCRSLDEYILRESMLDVFGWNSRDGNRNVQLSNTKKLFVGGGDPEVDTEAAAENTEETAEWGMALALDRDLLRGTSSRCATFGSNPLMDRSRHEGSDVFEIMNMEIWALTPCMNEEAAEELELGRTFVMGFHKQQ